MFVRHCPPGKVNSFSIALASAIFSFAGLLFTGCSSSPYSIEKAEEVEAMEVMQGMTASRKNGVQLAQAESLRGGGSSRLIVTRPAAGGGFLLVRGTVPQSFVAKHIPLDKMLHLRINRDDFRVKAGEAPVKAVLMLARTETTPLRVDAVSSNPEIPVIDTLFANQTLQPVPPGIVTAEKFKSDKGMEIGIDFGSGRQGVVSFGETVELNFTLDPLSIAWVEMPIRVSLQHTAVGAEDLQLGILIPLAGGRGPFSVEMFGEKVATVSAP